MLRGNKNSVDIMGEWLKCYAKTFSDLSVVISSEPTTCNAQETKAKPRLNLDIDSLLDLSSLNEKYDEVKSAISYIEDDLAKEMIKLITDSNKKIIEAKDTPVDEQLLNKTFAEDHSDEGLLLIDDIASRIKAEMHLHSDGKLDPNSFAPLYNAVVMSKLTLLSAQSLNELQRRAGVEYPDTFNQNYSYGSKEYFNILFNAIKTLDGNHIWLEIAPPMPRIEGKEDAKWPNERAYGYKNSNGYGFNLFYNPDAREKVFNKIFKGPLNSGLLTPHLIDMDTLVSDTYPYKPCPAYPFPNGAGDSTCEELESSDTPIEINGSSITYEQLDEQEESFGMFNSLATLVEDIFGSLYKSFVNYVKEFFSSLL